MASVSALPTELWLQILRSIYEVSLSSDILLRDYPWVDTLRTRSHYASASVRRGAIIRSISQVCRSWKMFANQLRYQEIELGFSSSFHTLLIERQSHSGIFNETRRLSVTREWSNKNNAQELSLLVQSMPRLEWLQFSTCEIEGSYLRTWLPSFLGHQTCLLYLDLKSLYNQGTVFVNSETIILISTLAIHLRRLTCAIQYVSGSDGQVRRAPRFEDLQVLQLIDIRCDQRHEQVACDWFSRWHLPSLKQFHVPRNWEYCTKLLGGGVGAQLEVLDASARPANPIPKQLWLLCPRVHTVIILIRAAVPLEARPKLHYIFVHPFDKWATGFDEMVLNSLLTSLSSEWEEQVLVNREFTFSFEYTELSWKSWAEMRSSKLTFMSQVRAALVGWKHFAEKHQMEVLDGYGIDIRDVVLWPPSSPNRLLLRPVSPERHFSARR